MLVIPVDGEPTIIVPRLERPDAENAPSASILRFVDWTDGSDPYRGRGGPPRPEGVSPSRTRPGRCTFSVCRRALPDSPYTSMTASLPMLRAIKDAAEIERLAAAGDAADRRTRRSSGAFRRT